MRQQLAQHLFNIQTLPTSISIKSTPTILHKRKDWFSSVQSPIESPMRHDLQFPKGKHLLFLDMDETILARSSHWFFNGDDQQKIKVGSEFIIMRPHFNEFVTQLRKKYHIVLFTASYPDRLTSILPFLNHEFDMVLDRRDTTPGQSIYFYKFKLPVFKHLLRFNIDLKQSVLLDDNPNYFLSCQENGIKIKPYFGGPDDMLPRYCDLLLNLADSPNFQHSIAHLKNDYKDVFEGTRWIF